MKHIFLFLLSPLPLLVGYSPQVSAQASSTQNYVATTTVLQAGTTTTSGLNSLTATGMQQQITYLDGLGRPVQKVVRQGSPGLHDIVEPIEYDVMGRPLKNYLPYVAGFPGSGVTGAAVTDGSLKANAVSQQSAFYTVGGDRIANDAAPYAQTVYEASALNRTLKKGEAGTAWQPTTAGHALQTAFRTNDFGTDQVRRWTFTNGVASSAGMEWMGEFLAKETRDEHGSIVVEYSDKLGRVALKKVQASDAAPTTDADFLFTYNVYDDFGNLRLVIPPAGVREIPASGAWTASAAFITKWCFSYTYDERQRVIAKQVPGAGTTQYVYNQRNQVVLTEDARGNRVFTKYDALGRAIMTGNYYSSATMAQLQATANTIATQYESVIPGNTANRLAYSLTNSFPTDINEYNLLTRTFYDSYDFDANGSRAFAPVTIAASAISSQAGQVGFSVTDSDRSTQVQGLVTIQQEQDSYYGGSSWLTTVFYYDNKGRVIQTLADHFGGGEERSTLKLSFTGQVLQSYLLHSFPTTAHPSAPFEQHTIYQENTYDAGLRLTQTSLKVDTQEKLLLSTLEYNEIGQLVDKKLHSTDQGNSFLQSVDYRYNIRGWLININSRNLNNNEWLDDTDPNSDNLTSNIYSGDAYYYRSPTVEPDLFGLELKYDDRHSIGLSAAQHPAQYNGNIATALWKTRNAATGNTLRAYAYRYDKLNRITDARYRTYEGTGTWGTYGTDYSTTGVAYDANGNITDMTRQGDGPTTGMPAPLDQLHYSYSNTNGNQLVAVDDAVVASTPTHDFEDNGHVYAGPTGTGQPEYSYDENGNLTQDRNKGIIEISYNLANLPEWITFENYRYIHFVYSAGGIKRQKVTYEWVPAIGNYTIHTTDYVSGFVYEDQVLAFAPTPEGRMIYTDNSANPSLLSWKYEYHLRDQLGNMRFAFRADGNSAQQRSAGLEPVNAQQEEEHFENIAEVRQNDPVHARTGDYVAYLNAKEGRREGPSITHPVAAGDSVYAEVYGRYDHPAPWLGLARKGAIVAGAVVAADPVGRVSDQAKPSVRKSKVPFLGASLAIVPQLFKPKKDELPTAFLRYELFTKDSVLVATRTRPLERTVVDTWQQLKTGMRADSAGYVKVSLINESGQPAYFDDLLLRPVDAAKVQENHYDPWGLNLVGIEQRGTPNYKFQYNGKEKQEEFGLNWSDYGARMYDAQLGRFQSVDRYANKYKTLTPYQYGANNPINIIDINGDSLWITHNLGKGTETLLYNNGALYNKDGSSYTGKVNGFLKQVTNSLATIDKAASGKGMLNELEKSLNNFTIIQGKSEFNETNKTTAHANQLQNDPAQATSLQGLTAAGISLTGGSGGTISWNPNGATLPTTSGGTVNASTDLAHEMFHALDANRGLLDERNDSGVKRGEWQAVYRENVLRGELGAPLRTNYIISVDPSGNFLGGAGVRMLTPTNQPILPVNYKP